MDPNGPGRLPSDRPGPCGPVDKMRSLFAFAVLPGTLSPAASRSLPRQRPTGRFRLSPRLPCLPRRARVFCNARSRRSMPDITEKDASFRLLQPTYDHVHPARTIRFPNVTAPLGTPCGAALQGLRPLGPPSGALALADACSIGYLVKLHRTAFSLSAGSVPPGGASLDGDPPASAIVDDPDPTGTRSRSPGRSPGRGRRTVLVELRSVAPPCCASRPRLCRPRTEIVT